MLSNCYYILQLFFHTKSFSYLLIIYVFTYYYTIIISILKNAVRSSIGPFATPDYIVYGDLPKTRSGKIMRRILRKIAAHEEDSIGDVSTLADPSVVDKLIAQFKLLKA